MLDKLRNFFIAAPAADDADPEAALHLAAAMLLIEVAKTDHELDDEELARIRDVLARHWGLGEQDLDDLLQVARDSSDASVSLHRHIDLINSNFSRQRKVALVRGLWEVACADQDIHHHEEALIRRVADLIHVPHRDFIRTKHRALARE